MPHDARAAIVNWSGATSAVWSDPANWVGGVLPAAADSVRVNAPASFMPVISGGSSTFSTLMLGTVSGSLGGNLTLMGSGTISSTSGTIGSVQGADGTVLLTGAGALWRNANQLVVGDRGNGTLIVSNGARGESTVANIAQNATSTQSVMEVDGAGSQWSASVSVVVGASGTGTLRISNGGTVIQGDPADESRPGGVNIGNAAAGGIGSALITGSGSALRAYANTFSVAYGGRGILLIGSGGYVLSDTVSRTVIANGASSVGAVNVEGTGSVWENNHNIVMGVTSGAQAALTVSNAGRVSAPSVVLASVAGTTAVLNVGSASGSPPEQPGVLDTPSVVFGLGTGRLVFNHGDTGYVFSPAIDGPGNVDVENGTTVMASASHYTGVTHISQGTLTAGAAAVLSENADYLVEAGGVLDLGGLGQQVHNLTNSGTVSIGTEGSAGALLQVSGDYAASAAVIAMRTELGDQTSPSDVLKVTGSTSGTTTLHITNAGGAGAQATGNGILVVQVQGDSNGVFVLDSSLSAGAYKYTLVKESDGNWYLQSALPEVIPVANIQCVPEALSAATVTSSLCTLNLDRSQAQPTEVNIALPAANADLFTTDCVSPMVIAASATSTSCTVTTVLNQGNAVATANFAVLEGTGYTAGSASAVVVSGAGAAGGGGATPPGSSPQQSIPTLSEFGMFVLVLLMAGVGGEMYRRQDRG